MTRNTILFSLIIWTISVASGVAVVGCSTTSPKGTLPSAVLFYKGSAERRPTLHVRVENADGKPRLTCDTDSNRTQTYSCKSNAGLSHGFASLEGLVVTCLDSRALEDFSKDLHPTENFLAIFQEVKLSFCEEMTGPPFGLKHKPEDGAICLEATIQVHTCD
jgi:hypothetical protein